MVEIRRTAGSGAVQIVQIGLMLKGKKKKESGDHNIEMEKVGH